MNILLPYTRIRLSTTFSQTISRSHETKLILHTHHSNSTPHRNHTQCTWHTHTRFPRHSWNAKIIVPFYLQYYYVLLLLLSYFSHSHAVRRVVEIEPKKKQTL